MLTQVIFRLIENYINKVHPDMKPRAIYYLMPSEPQAVAPQQGQTVRKSAALSS